MRRASARWSRPGARRSRRPACAPMASRTGAMTTSQNGNMRVRRSPLDGARSPTGPLVRPRLRSHGTRFWATYPLPGPLPRDRPLVFDTMPASPMTHRNAVRTLLSAVPVMLVLGSFVAAGSAHGAVHRADSTTTTAAPAQVCPVGCIDPRGAGVVRTPAADARHRRSACTRPDRDAGRVEAGRPAAALVRRERRAGRHPGSLPRTGRRLRVLLRRRGERRWRSGRARARR